MPHALHVLALTALIAAGLPGSGAAQSGQTATPGLDDRAVNRQVDERQPPAQIRGQRPVEMVLVTSPGRVASNPAAFYGTRVSVHAPVSRSLNPHAFTLEPNSWWQFGDNLTVLVPMPAAGARLGPNEYVTVVGTVRPFVRAELERDYGWFDDLPDFNIDLTRQPVIVADMVRTTDGTLLTERSKPVSRVLIADAGDIADVPGRFYGQTVSVRAEVENVWSPRAFTLDEDQWFAGPDVLVFNPDPITTTTAGLDNEQVTVIGTVRPYIVSEFEQDYDWFNAADYDRFNLTGWERRPVIVASSIRLANHELVQFRPALTLDATETAVMRRAENWRSGAADMGTARMESARVEQRSPDTATKPGGAMNAPGKAAMLKIAKGTHGQYLTDADGRALYLFMADKGQQGSTCYDACAAAWPPYTSTQPPVAEDAALQRNMLGTITRRDGTMQVTYNGWPLYYYVKDQGAGQATGQDVKGFGAEWYLVTPDGSALGHK